MLPDMFLSGFRYLGLSVLGFMFPRILVAAGFPLDVWAQQIGTRIAGATFVMSSHAAINICGVVIAVLFVTAEIWCQPARRLIAAVPSGLNWRSPLVVSVGEHGPYLKATNYMVYTTRRTYLIGVQNRSNEKTARKCLITIESISPNVGRDGPWVLDRNQDISAGDCIFVPLVTLGESASQEYQCGDSFSTIETDSTTLWLDIDKQYNIKVRVTAQDVPPTSFTCKVWVDSKGRLRIRKSPAAW